MQNFRILTIIGLQIVLYSFINSNISAQSQNFNNGNLENVNAVWINDPGPEEGIKWLGTAANWNIDVTPENRSNADGNLNLYGTSGKIVLWRPLLLKNELQVIGSGNHYISNGNLGIGTTTPTTTLHLIDETPFFTIGNSSETSAGIRFTDSDDSSGQFAGVEYNSASNALTLNQDVGGVNTVMMSILSSGNIGIGTTTPDAKLAVNGTIHTKEVKVDLNGWSDFVFEDDYVLRSLEETEEFIAENKHLPEIPSEAEVTEKGINLGEMDAKLLQKIEELTLYLIKQNKEIIEMKKEISDLKNE